MSENQVGCKLGDKMLDELIDCEYDEPCCYDNNCCEGNDCDCCNDDGNKPMGHCDCMVSDDMYSEYLENQEKAKQLNKKFEEHQKNCRECQLG